MTLLRVQLGGPFFNSVSGTIWRSGSSCGRVIFAQYEKALSLKPLRIHAVTARCVADISALRSCEAPTAARDTPSLRSSGISLQEQIVGLHHIGY